MICGRRRLLIVLQLDADLQIEWKMDDVPQVVVAADVGLLEHSVKILIYSFGDDVWIDGQDGDVRTVGRGEQRLDRIEDVENQLLFARVQPVNDDHHARGRPLKSVDAAHQPSKRVRLALQGAQERLGAQLAVVVSRTRDARVRRVEQVEDESDDVDEVEEERDAGDARHHHHGDVDALMRHIVLEEESQAS